jgi:hypothetical protein
MMTMTCYLLCTKPLQNPRVPQNYGVLIRARICKRLRSPGIDSASLCSLAGKRVVVTASQAGHRFLGSLKGLQIRAQIIRRIEIRGFVEKQDR